MSLSEKLKKSLYEKWCMRFKISVAEVEEWDGIVVHIGRDFVAISQEYDFEVDGLMIFPKRVLKGYRDDRFERCFNEILRENGQIKKAVAPKWLTNCTRLVDALQYCYHKDIWPAIDIVYEEKGLLYLGPLVDVNEKELKIYGYDADGSWEMVYTLSLKEICRVEINSRYCRTFNNFMRKRPRPSA